MSVTRAISGVVASIVLSICALGGSSQLSVAQVASLADSAARQHGYDLAKYTRDKPSYDSDLKSWIIIYQQKPKNGLFAIDADFSVNVSDRTKKTSVSPSP